jgi:hypothetical protein
VSVSGLADLKSIDVSILGDYTTAFEFVAEGELAVKANFALIAKNANGEILQEDDFVLSVGLENLQVRIAIPLIASFAKHKVEHTTRPGLHAFV